MNATENYLDRCTELVDTIRGQQDTLKKVAAVFAESILQGGLVHLFASGHSRIMVEEMWPRYGSFPGFHPIVELSLTYHNQVVGANGQRQAMYLENVSGLASRILRNFNIDSKDSALIISSGGSNLVPLEMAEAFQEKGVHVTAMVSMEHSKKSSSKHPDGKMLTDFADEILDTGAPVGDAMITIPGLDTPVSPGSTVGGVILVNCLKAETAKVLVESNYELPVLTAANIIGSERSKNIFEKAYDRHATNISRLYDFSKVNPR